MTGKLHCKFVEYKFTDFMDFLSSKSPSCPSEDLGKVRQDKQIKSTQVYDNS